MLVHSASSRRSNLLGPVALGLGLAIFAAAPGCSSDDSAATTEAGVSSGTAGGGGSGSATEGGACPTPTPSTGAADSCTDDGGPINQEATSCPTTPPDGGDDSDAGADETYDTHDGTASPDDDCKYDVSYTVDCPGGSTTFTITLKSRVTMMPLTGADPQLEAFMGDSHPLPNSPAPVTTEVGNGVYKISGVPFDSKGMWTIRFHFYEMCLDIGETSKHAHVAFSLNVP